jgi:hypothetical protein
VGCDEELDMKRRSRNNFQITNTWAELEPTVSVSFALLAALSCVTGKTKGYANHNVTKVSDTHDSGLFISFLAEKTQERPTTEQPPRAGPNTTPETII